MKRLSILPTDPLKKLLLTLLALSVFSSAARAREDETGLLLVSPFENLRGVPSKDWMATYLKIALEVSLSGIDGYYVPSPDNAAFWIKSPPAETPAKFRKITGGFQYFDNLFLIRLSQDLDGVVSDHWVEGAFPEISSKVRELVLELSPEADTRSFDLLPFPLLDENFRRFLELRFQWWLKPQAADFAASESLAEYGTFLRHPEPYVRLALSLVVLVASDSGRNAAKKEILNDAQSVAFAFLREFRDSSELKSLIALVHFLRNGNRDLMEKYAKAALKNNPGNDLALLLAALSLGLNTGEGKSYLERFKRIHPWHASRVHRENYFFGVFEPALASVRPDPFNDIPFVAEEEKPLDEYASALAEAEALKANGNLPEYEIKLTEMTEKFPDENGAKLLLSDVLTARKAHVENLELLETAIPSPDEWPEIQRRKGLSHLFLKHWQKSLENFDGFLEKRPEDLEILQKAAVAAINLNRLDYARERLDEALEVGGENAETYRHLGEVAYRENNPTEAEIHWKNSLRLDPSNRFVVQRLNSIR